MRSLKQRKYATKVANDGRTEQNHAKDCDINVIMARAMRGQSSPYLRQDAGYYGDATSLSFYEAQAIVANAKTMFEELPSKIRNKFNNDPGEFLTFIQDPANKPEAIELGLIKKEKPSPDLTIPPPAALAAEGGEGVSGEGATPQGEAPSPE